MKIKNNINKLLCSPFLITIWLYQKIISPIIPPSCIYWPSCSEYARQAFQKHGPIWGLYLSIRRLMRCHPFHQGGVDEVPDSIHFNLTMKNG